MYTYRVAVAYLAIKLHSCYVHAALLSLLRRTCMANRSCYERVAIFLNMFKKSSHLFEPLQTRRSCSVSATEAFDAVTLPCDLGYAVRSQADS